MSETPSSAGNAGNSTRGDQAATAGTPKSARPRSTLARCPECDLDLEGIDIRAHALYHYPTEPDPRNPHAALAAERYATLINAAKRQTRAREDSE